MLELATRWARLAAESALSQQGSAPNDQAARERIRADRDRAASQLEDAIAGTRFGAFALAFEPTTLESQALLALAISGHWWPPSPSRGQRTPSFSRTTRS